jgi:O-antigen/teichoic acid export membrane protein
LLKSIILKSGLFGGAHQPLFHGAAALLLLRFIQLSSALAGTYFVARSMGKNEFGEYNMVLNSVGILTIFTLSGLNNSLMQAVARGYEGTFRACVPLAFACSFIGSAILLGMSAYYFVLEQNQLGWSLSAAALLFPFAHGLVQWKSVIIGRARFEQLLVHDGASSILTYGLIIVSVRLYPGQYVFPIVLTVLVPAFYNVGLTLLNLRAIRPEAPVEQQNVRYGMKITLYSGLGAIGSNLDRVLLFFLLSPAALATFVAASRIPDLLGGIIQDVSAVLAPRLSKHPAYTKRMDRIFSVLSLAYGAAIVVFAFSALPTAVKLLFGDNYAEAIPYAQALACAVAVGNLANLRFRYVRSRIDARGFRDITLFSSLVRLVAFLALVPPFGLVGAVVAAFIYRLALMGAARVVIKRHYAALG